MDIYEYKTVIINNNFNIQADIENTCNEYGKEGWELVNFQFYELAQKIAFVFKRKK